MWTGRPARRWAGAGTRRASERPGRPFDIDRTGSQRPRARRASSPPDGRLFLGSAAGRGTRAPDRSTVLAPGRLEDRPEATPGRAPPRPGAWNRARRLGDSKRHGSNIRGGRPPAGGVGGPGDAGADLSGRPGASRVGDAATRSDTSRTDRNSTGPVGRQAGHTVCAQHQEGPLPDSPWSEALFLSGGRDLNSRPPDPQSGALPNCATARWAPDPSTGRRPCQAGRAGRSFRGVWAATRPASRSGTPCRWPGRRASA